MAIYITEIGKHRFVCGLFWQSLSRPRELMREAAALARKIDFDLMVLRKDHAAAQAGFAQSADGARRNLYSLGAAVSKTLALEGVLYDGQKQRIHNWLGAFKLPDGKWAYFAVRDANFLPNGDFAGTKEQVLERLSSDYGLGGWNAVIGEPELEELGYHNFNARRIEDLLPRTRTGRIRTHGWWKLSAVNRRLPWLPLTVAAIALGLAAGGSLYWQHEQKRKAEQERDRAIEAARKRMFNEGAVATELPRPWASKPAPLGFAQACLSNFSHLTAGGWTLDEYACANGHANYTWSRRYSSVGFLLEQVPGAVFDLEGNKASFVVPLAALPTEEEALLGQKNLIEPMLTRLQLMSLVPRIAKLAPPRPAGSSPGHTLPPPAWNTFSFSLATNGIPPADVAAVLNQPGVRIDKLVWRSGIWTIEGEMYAN